MLGSPSDTSSGPNFAKNHLYCLPRVVVLPYNQELITFVVSLWEKVRFACSLVIGNGWKIFWTLVGRRRIAPRLGGTRDSATFRDYVTRTPPLGQRLSPNLAGSKLAPRPLVRTLSPTLTEYHPLGSSGPSGCARGGN